ncbi:MAG: squalene/phytoene synthase family protein, partial [Candidatus Hodarchaeales archaeon]
KSKNINSIAKSIVRKSNKLTYLIILLLVDKNLRKECFKAYAYFRWLDDLIDNNGAQNERIKVLINRQKVIIQQAYNDEKPNASSPEEEILIELIKGDKRDDSYLKSYILNFFSIIEFDSTRKGKNVSNQELKWYSETVGKAVTDCIFYFIGNHIAYPESENRYLAAEGAHITHMLRDYREDIKNGYFNIPIEFLTAKKITIDEINCEEFRHWVKERTILARLYFYDGKKYIYDLKIFRTKIAALWYCLRFEKVLDAIEKNSFDLCSDNFGHRKPILALKMIGVVVKTYFHHIRRKRDQ